MDSDVLKLKQAQEALKQSETRFRAFVENTNDMFWETDAAFAYTYSSPNVSMIMGYEAHEIIGKTPFDFMPCEEAKRVKAELTGLIEERQLFLIEHEIICKQGDVRIIECSGRPIVDEHQTLLGYRGVNRDITERKKVERQLRLSQKMEAIGNMAGGIAHDFNNLLTVISGYCDVLIDDSSPEEIQSAIAGIKRASNRAANLTHRLLAFARRQVMQPAVFDLNALIEDLSQMLRRIIGEHIELERNFVEGPCFIKADSSQIEQVIMNLVLNARDAMPNGGKLKIETSRISCDGNPELQGVPIREGAYVVLLVSDSGIGMSPEIQSRIFEPFFTTKETGEGLGLATAYGIVKQSGGYIWAASDGSLGTTFKIYLPAGVEAHTKTVSPAPSAAKSQFSGKVLLAEDEEEVRWVIRRMLESIGFSVIEAANGEDAIQLHRTHGNSIDVLLTDVVMPKMNGVELASRLKAYRQDIKIVLMSGYMQNTISEYDLPLAAGTFLRKPFSKEELETKMHQVLKA